MSYREIKTLKAMVENVLRDIPDTRNSDITLTIEIWRKFYPQYLHKGEGELQHVALSSLYELPREDNVKRARAYFQNVKKLYLPTELKVARARGINEDEWRISLGFPTKATTGSSHPSWTPPSESGVARHNMLQSNNENKTVSKMSQESVQETQSKLGF